MVKGEQEDACKLGHEAIHNPISIIFVSLGNVSLSIKSALGKEKSTNTSCYPNVYMRCVDNVGMGL